MKDFTEQQLEEKVIPPLPLHVRFYHNPVVSEVINGVNIYQPREMVEIKVEGEKNTSISKIATDKHRHEYASSYKLFKDRLFEDLTPLCAITDQMTAQSLIDLGIKSVDELATADKLPLFDHLREQAKKLLEIKNAHSDRREHSNNKEELQRETQESEPVQNRPQHAEDRQQHVHLKEENNQEENGQNIIFEMSYSL